MKRQRILIFALCVIALTLVLTFCTAERKPEDELIAAKPVIYLYPPEKTDVTVQLDYSADLFVTYPAYGVGRL